MHIISFATMETKWSVPRLGMILHVGDQDTGYRLDCEKLFSEAERASNPLAWFGMDGPSFPDAREIHDILTRDKQSADDAHDKRWRVPSSDAYWFAPVPR